MDTQKNDKEASSEAENLSYALAFGNRVRELRGAMSRADFAHALGIHPNTVGKFERGESMPDALLITKICAIGKKPVQWLVTGQLTASDIPERGVQAVESGDFIWVPLFDVYASAGHGAFIERERVLAMRPFDVSFIRSELGIAHNEIAMCTIVGNSASPRLNSRDCVLMDMRDRDVRTEGMHIVRLEGALLAKRLQRLPGRMLRVSSTNEEYEPFEISGDDETERDFEVIGRIRWGGVIFQ